MRARADYDGIVMAGWSAFVAGDGRKGSNQLLDLLAAAVGAGDVGFLEFGDVKGPGELVFAFQTAKEVLRHGHTLA
ncbi:MAG TPA: hypothetical protein VMV57_16445 [Terracidiphilus sp.]|nr:hypothetical protein [Terracidiphilus sp.]